MGAYAGYYGTFIKYIVFLRGLSLHVRCNMRAISCIVIVMRTNTSQAAAMSWKCWNAMAEVRQATLDGSFLACKRKSYANEITITDTAGTSMELTNTSQAMNSKTVLRWRPYRRTGNIRGHEILFSRSGSIRENLISHYTRVQTFSQS